MKAGLVSSLLLVLLIACGASPEDLRKEAQAKLDAGDPAAALQLAETALKDPAIAANKADAWRFESIRLEGLARTSKGGVVATELDRLAGSYSGQVTAALYRSVADKARAAGDNSGAIAILEAGDKRFPAEKDSFAEAIQAINAAGGLDPAEIERLKALGYL